MIHLSHAEPTPKSRRSRFLVFDDQTIALDRSDREQAQFRIVEVVESAQHLALVGVIKEKLRTFWQLIFAE